MYLVRWWLPVLRPRHGLDGYVFQFCVTTMSCYPHTEISPRMIDTSLIGLNSYVLCVCLRLELVFYKLRFHRVSLLSFPWRTFWTHSLGKSAQETAIPTQHINSIPLTHNSEHQIDAAVIKLARNLTSNCNALATAYIIILQSYGKSYTPLQFCVIFWNTNV